MDKLRRLVTLVVMGWLVCGAASAQSFRVQCPLTTNLHNPGANNPGSIKCQQISGGDGYATMADGTQTYLFAFGPLSGLNNIANGMPGTEDAQTFMTPFDPSAAVGSPASNGAVGLAIDPDHLVNGVSCAALPQPVPQECYTGHVDPRQIMDVGVMNGNIPAPMMAIDEDDEYFLTLTNVGMIMRPDLFEQHTVHFHGYPNASSFYDGVPDASVAINIGGSFTYYYLAPDAGTYFFHCHITPPEHLQMGMVGQLYVRRGRIVYLARRRFGKDCRRSKRTCGQPPIVQPIFCARVRCRHMTTEQHMETTRQGSPLFMRITTGTVLPPMTWSTQSRFTVLIPTFTL